MQIQTAVSTLTSFEWGEYKDLAKQFLTLVVGVLVFSVTFSEKIVDFQKAPKYQKILLIVTWGLMILALILAGLGLWIMYQVCLSAMYDGTSLRPNGPGLAYAYISINLAGVLFVLSLAMIGAVGAMTLLKAHSSTRT
jgi:hypothetical protein